MSFSSRSIVNETSSDRYPHRLYRIYISGNSFASIRMAGEYQQLKCANICSTVKFRMMWKINVGYAISRYSIYFDYLQEYLSRWFIFNFLPYTALAVSKRVSLDKTVCSMGHRSCWRFYHFSATFL